MTPRLLCHPATPELSDDLPGQVLALLQERSAALPGGDETAGTGQGAEALPQVRPACLHTPLFLGIGLLGTAAISIMGLIEGQPVFALLGGGAMAALLSEPSSDRPSKSPMLPSTRVTSLPRRSCWNRDRMCVRPEVKKSRLWQSCALAWRSQIGSM